MTFAPGAFAVDPDCADVPEDGIVPEAEAEELPSVDPPVLLPVAGAAPMALARLSRGEVLGEIAAFDGGPRSATATAGVVAETHLASWDVAAFHRFLAARPQAGLLILTGLLRKLGSRLRQTSEAVQTLVRAL